MENTKFRRAQSLSYIFKIMAIGQVGYYFFHLWFTYKSVYPQPYCWAQSIRINKPFDYQRTWNKRFQFPDNVDIRSDFSELVFSFSYFQELLNPFTISFFLIDTLKWAIIVFVLWQLSKAFKFNGDFKVFSTEGVKSIRRAAIPIMAIPLLTYISKVIFVLYAQTQTSQLGHSLYRAGSNDNDWGYYLFATIILVGLSELFSYGSQLKEETDLTV